ncbi:MAG: Nif11-like leader peptide family natural product precursor [Rivularia sp. ALOHA_DT_140]|nr:Nif11-like leader peptide family natural product precursor [Rivularia sp. ALOHA_DT_140]
MSVQNALQFIEKLRVDEDLKNQLGNSPDLKSFVEVGRSVGFIFTVEQLKTAHKQDWAMRWLVYMGK